LEIFPRSGHTLNLEEPEHFNRSLLEFITAVDAGHWEARTPEALPRRFDHFGFRIKDKKKNNHRGRRAL